VVVLVLNNWRNVLSGFTSLASPPQATAVPATPAAVYATSTGNPQNISPAIATNTAPSNMTPPANTGLALPSVQSVVGSALGSAAATALMSI
jgi:hypothetical protein